MTVLPRSCESMAVTQFAKDHPIGLTGVVLASAWRLVPHYPNMTPVGGLCLYAGARVKGWAGYTLCMLCLFVTDMAIAAMNIYAPWNQEHTFQPFGLWSVFTYVSFTLNYLLGYDFLRNTTHLAPITGVTLLGTAQFFLMTNFGAWASQTPPFCTTWTWGGLTACYAAGLPYAANSAIGDLTFSFALFLAHYALTQYPLFAREKVQPAIEPQYAVLLESDTILV